MPDRPRDGSADYLSVGESTARTGLSARTLRRYEEQGRLSASRTPGGHRRYLAKEIEALIEPAASADPMPAPRSSAVDLPAAADAS